MSDDNHILSLLSSPMIQPPLIRLNNRSIRFVTHPQSQSQQRLKIRCTQPRRRIPARRSSPLSTLNDASPRQRPLTLRIHARTAHTRTSRDIMQTTTIPPQRIQPRIQKAHHRLSRPQPRIIQQSDQSRDHGRSSTRTPRLRQLTQRYEGVMRPQAMRTDIRECPALVPPRIGSKSLPGLGGEVLVQVRFHSSLLVPAPVEVIRKATTARRPGLGSGETLRSADGGEVGARRRELGRELGRGGAVV